jgi:hypothetical protein
MEAVNYEVEGGTSYLALPRETTRYVDSLFMKVRNGISLEGDNGSNVVLWIVIAVAVLAAGTVALLLIKKHKKKKH